MMNAPIFAALVAVGDGASKREEMRSADGGRWGLTKGKKMDREKRKQGYTQRVSEIVGRLRG